MEVRVNPAAVACLYVPDVWLVREVAYITNHATILVKEVIAALMS